MKIIFLDFDGVMDTAYYDHILSKKGLQGNDSFGIIFDPNCVRNLAEVIEKTGADIVVSSSWKYFMSYKDFLDMWEYRNLPGFVTDVTPTPTVRRLPEQARHPLAFPYMQMAFLLFHLFHLFTFQPFPRPLYGKLESSLWKTAVLSMKY